jgi:hypothetical protein
MHHYFYSPAIAGINQREMAIVIKHRGSSSNSGTQCKKLYEGGHQPNADFWSVSKHHIAVQRTLG